MKHVAVFLAFSVFFLSSVVAADQRNARSGNVISLNRCEDSREISRLQAYICSIWGARADERSSAWMYDVTLSLRGKRYNVVLQHFDALVKYDPKFAECWNKRATVLYLLGRFEESIADIQEVPVLEKGHFGAQSDLGLCYQALGDGEVALEAYQRELQANLHFQFLSCKIERLRKNI